VAFFVPTVAGTFSVPLLTPLYGARPWDFPDRSYQRELASHQPQPHRRLLTPRARRPGARNAAIRMAQGHPGLHRAAPWPSLGTCHHLPTGKAMDTRRLPSTRETRSPRPRPRNEVTAMYSLTRPDLVEVIPMKS